MTLRNLVAGLALLLPLVGAGCLLPFDPALLDGGAQPSDGGEDDGGVVTFVTAVLRDTDFPVQPPAGAQPDDLLIGIWVGGDGLPASLTPPPNWTQLGRSHLGQSGNRESSLWAGYKLVTAGEGASTFSSSSAGGGVVLVLLRGARTVDPIAPLQVYQSYSPRDGGVSIHFTPDLTATDRSLGIVYVETVRMFDPSNDLVLPADGGLVPVAVDSYGGVYRTAKMLESGASLPRLMYRGNASIELDPQWVGVGAFLVHPK